MASLVRLYRPGTLPYADALIWMRESHAALANGEGAERLALLQHPPVYTVGARGGTSHLLVPTTELAARGVELEEVDRGGDITFHGPGQLVAYPILDLRRRELRATDYVRALEQIVIDALAILDVPAQRIPSHPGVWTTLDRANAPPEKIAAIGVRIRRGVSTHGLALNVSTDLGWFDAIVPCGIADAGVTSLERVLGRAVTMAEAETALTAAFVCRFDAELLEQDTDETARDALTTGTTSV